MTIRNCQKRDLDDLLDLFGEVVEERAWLGTEPGFDRDKYRERWSSMIDGDNGALFVAIEDEALIGFIATYPRSEHGCSIGMMVRQGYRDRGIGSALLREAIRWAGRAGEPVLSLGVFPHNTAAIALYENHGFKEKCRLPGYDTRQNGDVWDMIVMTLPLSGNTS